MCSSETLIWFKKQKIKSTMSIIVRFLLLLNFVFILIKYISSPSEIQFHLLNRAICPAQYVFDENRTSNIYIYIYIYFVVVSQVNHIFYKFIICATGL